MKIVLASKSPRRIELLKGLGWTFDVIPSSKPENVDLSLAPQEVVKALSLQKAQDVASCVSSAWVIGADTIVATDGKILGKPEDEDDACSMLLSLEGRTHEVFTGVTVINPCGEVLTTYTRSLVTMKHLTKSEILSYISCGESMDKAGAYAIQGSGALLISNIEGDYFNVVGLPLMLLSSMLERLGFPLTQQLCGADKYE
ncbi:MAG: Maf family protein [Synergistaceae bacterium]|nr:Maf family protein [Synergistaceae bacterium]